MANKTSFCTFYVDRLLFGIELSGVQEVLRLLNMTQVPLAPSVVSGLINLRGQIVTAIDLRARLGLPLRSGGACPMNVIVRTDDGAVSLLVDEIGDVIVVDDDTFETAPETLRGPVRSMILGVHKLEGRLVHVLDTAKACQLSATAGSPGPGAKPEAESRSA